MQWRNTEASFGAVHKLLHWSIAALIIFMLALGLYMGEVPMGPDKYRLYGLHKATGMVVLLLAGLRLAWRLVNAVPPLPANTPRWQRLLANIVHKLLYVMMFAMPITGWIISSAAGFPVSVYGLFTVPVITAPDKALMHDMGEVHENLAWILMALIAMHAGAALMHHFMYKDNILRRMLPCVKPLPPSA